MKLKQKPIIIVSICSALAALGIIFQNAGTPGSDPLFVESGQYHSCLLTPQKTVKCWGSANGFKESPTPSNPIKISTPVDVAGLNNIIDIAVGRTHTCFLNTSGAVLCIGNNNYGQLGDGTRNMRYGPAYVSGLTSGVVKISAGDGNSCALTQSGSVLCWGRTDWRGLQNNPYGYASLYGNTLDKLTPTAIPGLETGIVDISSKGYHTCALTSAGGVKCFGENYWYQLGTGDNTYRSSAVFVYGLDTGVQSVSAGVRHTCVIMNIGSVKCWGKYDGTLSNNTPNSARPAGIAGLSSGTTEIQSGSSATCVIVSGAAKCFGRKAWGALGDGVVNPDVSTLAPVGVIGLGVGVASLSYGASFGCATMKMGGVKCWGYNYEGNLGMGVDGTSNSSYAQLPTPQDVLYGTVSVVSTSVSIASLTVGNPAPSSFNITILTSGSPVPSKYEVNYRRVGAANWSIYTSSYAGSSTTLTVGGLSSNTVYEAKVKPMFANGTYGAETATKYVVTSTSGNIANYSLYSEEDAEDTGLFLDIGFALRSLSVGYSGKPFGQLSPSTFRGFQIERVARSGQTTFTIWIIGSASSVTQNLFSSLTLVPQNQNSNVAPKTLYVGEAEYSHNGTFGAWTWRSSPYTPLLNKYESYNISIEY